MINANIQYPGLNRVEQTAGSRNVERKDLAIDLTWLIVDSGDKVGGLPGLLLDFLGLPPVLTVLTSLQTVQQCSANEQALRDVFDIDVSEDNPDVHPATYCHPCRNVAYFRKVAKEQRKEYNSTRRVFHWEGHTDAIEV